MLFAPLNFIIQHFSKHESSLLRTLCIREILNNRRSINTYLVISSEKILIRTAIRTRNNKTKKSTSLTKLHRFLSICIAMYSIVYIRSIKMFTFPDLEHSQIINSIITVPFLHTPYQESLDRSR